MWRHFQLSSLEDMLGVGARAVADYPQWTILTSRNYLAPNVRSPEVVQPCSHQRSGCCSARYKVRLSDGWGAQLLSLVWLFCDPIDYNPPGSSVHGILQARILEWVAISFSRGSSWPSDWTCLLHLPYRQILYPWATQEALQREESPGLFASRAEWYLGPPCFCICFFNKRADWLPFVLRREMVGWWPRQLASSKRVNARAQAEAK